MSLFFELKRRGVIRMAVIYGVAAWLLMQVTEVLIGLSTVPEHIGPWVVLVLVIGFPIAVVLSWFFDITPEGIVREADAPAGQPAPAVGGRRMDFVIIAMLAAAVVLLLFWEPPVSEDEALTVLPFESLTGPDEASFSEGVSIELQNLLAQLRRFKVKPTPEPSILARFPDIPTLAREMGVRWVLKGSVRRAEHRVRIAVQLMDADDEMSIAWSNVFDRKWSAVDLFDIQAEIARSITSELRLSLDEPAEQRLAAPPTENSEAYAAYLIGRQRMTDRRVDWLEDAVEQFALAIELDPEFGEAYSGLVEACEVYGRFSNEWHEQCPDDDAEMVLLARKGVRLAPESGEAWVAHGYMITRFSLLPSIRQQGGDQGKVSALVGSDGFKGLIAEAEAAFQRGLALNPGYSPGYLRYAQFLFWKNKWNGTWNEAWEDGVWIKLIEQGLEVDPLWSEMHWLTFYPYWVKTREKSLWHARRIVEIAPDSPRGYMRLGAELWQNFGRADEMVRLASKAAQIDPKNGGYPQYNAHAYMALGDYEMALAYFRLARMLGRTQRESDTAEALVLLFAGRTDKALKRLESLQDVEGINPHVPLDVLAGNDLRTGRPEQALSRYRQHKPACFDDPYSDRFQSSCPRFGFMRVLQEAGDEQGVQSILAWQAERSKENLRGLRNPEAVKLDSDIMLHIRLDAIAGRHEQALSALEDFVEKGFRGWENLWLNWRFFAYHDITVDSIRDHPRLQAVVAEIEADMAQQLEKVRDMQRRGEVPTLEELNAEIAQAEAASAAASGEPDSKPAQH